LTAPVPEPTVSVIVPVRDDPEGVERLLAHLDRQTLARERFEVVIGDDGSRNGAVKRFHREDGRIRVEAGPPRTSYAARNRAAESARGRVLAFCDSDCLPEPTWLEEGLAALNAGDLVAGDVTLVPPERPTVWSLLTVDMFLDQKRAVSTDKAVTANLFVTREAFTDLGGFDPSLPSGGDFDFVLRAVEGGRQLSYSRSAVVRHPTLDAPREFLSKVWRTNWWMAARSARTGNSPSLAGVFTLVPLVGVVVARLRAQRPVARLHRPRLRASGITPSVRHDLRALPVLYCVVAVVGGMAQVGGWLAGLRLVREDWHGHGGRGHGALVRPHGDGSSPGAGRATPAAPG
jgi:GT2 family glycosyltransferase